MSERRQVATPAKWARTVGYSRAVRVGHHIHAPARPPAHGEVFASIRPATTMVFTRFIDPLMLIEIEAEAIIPS